jgi:hypothetical protein
MVPLGGLHEKSIQSEEKGLRTEPMPRKPIPSPLFCTESSDLSETRPATVPIEPIPDLFFDKEQGAENGETRIDVRVQYAIFPDPVPSGSCVSKTSKLQIGDRVASNGNSGPCLHGPETEMDMQPSSGPNPMQRLVSLGQTGSSINFPNGAQVAEDEDTQTLSITCDWD